MHGILHVRIRGGPGRVTARVYPTPIAPPGAAARSSVRAETLRCTSDRRLASILFRCTIETASMIGSSWECRGSVRTARWPMGQGLRARCQDCPGIQRVRDSKVPRVSR